MTSSLLSASLHLRNLQIIAIEMYKVANGDSPEIKNLFRFCVKEADIRHQNTFRGPIANTVF